MKRYITLIFFIISTSSVIAQDKLHEIMRGEHGLSKHFTTLSETQRVSFNAGELKTLLELKSNSNLVLSTADSDNIGYIHYRYYQTYKEYPIENSMLIINVKNGTIYNLVGSIVLDFNSQIDNQKEILSKEQAISNALKYVSAEKYAWQDENLEKALKKQMNDPKATNYPTVSKVWYNSGSEIESQNLRLAYKIDVYSIKPFDRKYVFVDAEDGTIRGIKTKILHTDATGSANTQYSGSRIIHSDLNGSTYRLRDIVKGNGVITLHGESGSYGSDYTSTTADWSLAGQNQHAMDAHWGLERTYSFYKSTFARKSFDNHNAAIFSYVNEYDADAENNAYWNGSSMHFGTWTDDLSGVTSIDVTGHEFTHGVTQYTSGLIYSNEPGAINESMSDIMGKAIQFFAKANDVNWVIGNDMGVSHSLRDMGNPNNFFQPDTYHGTFWYTGSADNGGVHTNSGVGNFMFFLLVNGGTGTNDVGSCYSITGIGIDKAEQILYRSETVYLFPSAQYADWRTACINAATDLYGANSSEVIAATNAWYAVGVGDPYSYTLSMSGPNVMCGNSQTYTLNGVLFGATVDWSLSGPIVGSYSCPLPLQNVCTMAENGNQVTLTKMNTYSAGNVHLYASITNCNGSVQSIYKDITIGVPSASYNGGYTTYYGPCKPIVGTINTTNSSKTWVSMAFPLNNQYTIVKTGGTSNASWNNTGGGTFDFTFVSPNSSSHIDFNITPSNTCGSGSSPVVFYYDGSAPRFSLTPNPTNNTVIISADEINNSKRSSDASVIKQIKIIDKLGNVKLAEKYGDGRNTIKVNVSKLRSDVYYLHIFDGKQWSVQKLMVLH